MVALGNLFTYPTYREDLYNELKANSVEYLFQRLCLLIIDHRLAGAEIQSDFFHLFRKYLEYEEEYGNEERSFRYVSPFLKLIGHIFAPQNHIFYAEYST